MANQTQTTTLNVKSNADLAGIKATEAELRNYGDELRRIKKEMEGLGSPELTSRAASQYLSRMKVEARKAQQEQINQVIGVPAKAANDTLMTMLKGGGIAAIISMLGDQLAKFSGQMAEYSKSARGPDFAIARQNLVESLPIVGGLATAFRNIWEYSGHAELKMAAITDAARMQDELTRMRANRIIAQNKALEDQLVLLRRIANETKLSGMGGATGSSTARAQAIIEEKAAAERRTRDANAALLKSGQDTPESTHAQEVIRNLGGRNQLLKEEWAQLDAAKKIMAERRKISELAVKELENAKESEAAIIEKTTKDAFELQRQHVEAMTGLTAQAAADRFSAMNRGAEAELVAMKESLRKQKEQYEHDKAAGANSGALSERQAEIDNTGKKIKESEAAIARERTQIAVDQGRRLSEIKSALGADDLRKQGKFAAATIAQMRQAHTAKLEQMKRDEAEELRQNPEFSDAIKKKFAGQREYDQRKLDNDARLAQLDETRTKQRLTDMTFDFGQRMQQRGKPTYTFDAQGVDAGSTGVGDQYKQRQAMDRQKLDAQREAIGFVREMRDYMQGIVAKMNAINIGSQ